MMTLSLVASGSPTTVAGVPTGMSLRLACPGKLQFILRTTFTASPRLKFGARAGTASESHLFRNVRALKSTVSSSSSVPFLFVDFDQVVCLCKR